MDARRRPRDDAHMPLDLTDLELETAARACRSLAYQESEAAKRLENPTVRAPVENTAQRAAALAVKFERARKGVKSGPA
jgi:hypothetical protein